MHAFLVFFGTNVAVVQAASGGEAYIAFRNTFAQDHGTYGRLTPPTRDEVKIRLPNESDRGWIEDSEDPHFMVLLDDLGVSA